MPLHSGEAEPSNPPPEGADARAHDLSQMLKDIETLVSQVDALNQSLREKREAWSKLAEKLSRDGAG